VGFAIFAAFAGFDALADRAGLEDRATFASFAMLDVRAALATLTARAARATLAALAFAALERVTWARFTDLVDLVADLVAALVALAFFVILDAAFADFAEIFADFFADLLADFEDPAGFVDFAAAPRAAITPRFVPLVALRFLGAAASESLPPTAAPSNEPCGKPQPISNCSAMRR
jgi:hypothetical protein